MQNATVTVRELKNKNSGVDLSIPTYSETAGLLGSTVEYMVVIVSNLDIFKLPKHKENDIIQFTVAKKFSDFEDLYKKLNEKFSGTAFPPLPKKVLLKSDAVYKERRNGLEHFLKFIAIVPKLVTSNVLLEFLGVKSSKVSQVKKEDKTHQEEEEKEGENQEIKEEREKKQNLDMFDEGETENELFLQEGEDGDDNMEDMFGDIDTTTESAAMFEVPDLGGGLREEEADDLVLPSAKIDKPMKKTEDMTEEERETSELLNIEDNLEELLKLNTKKPRSSEILQKSKPDPVPAPRKLKPDIPAKPKPGIPSKPKPTSRKPDITSKPSIPKKPINKGDNTDSIASKTPEPVELSNDDIMKYISENSSVDADLDLF